MSDDMVDKTVVFRINQIFMKFMDLNYSWILKQRIPTFGTVVSVADNDQDDVEIDSDWMYTYVNIYLKSYMYMTHVYMNTYTFKEEFVTLPHNSQDAIITHSQR